VRVSTSSRSTRRSCDPTTSACLPVHFAQLRRLPSQVAKWACTASMSFCGSTPSASWAKTTLLNADRRSPSPALTSHAERELPLVEVEVLARIMV